jgi:hypothetical protein
MKFITSSLLTIFALLAAANAFSPHSNAAFMPRGPQMAQHQARHACLASPAPKHGDSTELNMLDSSSSLVVADSALKFTDIVFPLAFYLLSVAFAVKNPEPRVEIDYSTTTSKLEGNAAIQASSAAVVVGEEAEAPKPKTVANNLTVTHEAGALENAKLLSLAATVAVKNPEPNFDIDFSTTISKLEGNTAMQASSAAVFVGEEAEAPKPKTVANNLTVTHEARALENSKLLSLAATDERQAQMHKYGALAQKEKKRSRAFMASRLLFRGFGKVLSPFKRIFSS